MNKLVISSLLLFVAAAIPGMLVFFYPSVQQKNFKSLLTFSGAYLFSITVIHIFPELFTGAENPTLIGISVLIGFYFQIILDFFSSGIEHGHIHKHYHEGHHTGAFVLFLSIWIHSFLEGSLLVHPHVNHTDSDGHYLLFGLLLHKIPESFALVSVLLFQLKSKILVMILLIVFALGSPFGLVLSELLTIGKYGSSGWSTYLFALIAGNFLHISTTIFFEAESQDHKFKGTKLIVIVLGAAIAILVEFILK